MAGKRKREPVVAPRQVIPSQEDPPSQGNSPAESQDAFRRYFEATFEPLPEMKASEFAVQENETATNETSEEESSWEGLSDVGDEAPVVQIVEHQADLKNTEDDEIRREQYKSFMSSKPPNEVEEAVRKANTGKDADNDEESEALNLKHDLDLQRLLRESHLLEQAKASSALGSHRHKAVDMRLQTMGSKSSLFHQEKMPLSHRKGMLAKSTSREATRRREARENGIILEKATVKGKSSVPRRERGVDAPAVGKFRGGTLKLSKHDLLDIQGSGRSGSRGKRGRR